MSADPRGLAVDCVLRDGGSIHVRAIRADDKQRLVDHFGRLSARSVYYRFFSAKKMLSDDELRQFTDLDFKNRVAVVATLGHGEAERIIGVGRYARLHVSPGEPAMRAARSPRSISKASATRASSPASRPRWRAASRSSRSKPDARSPLDRPATTPPSTPCSSRPASSAPTRWPVTDIDADDMIGRLRLAPLLDGYRGSAPGDRAALVDVICRLSALVDIVPELRAVTLDPVLLLPPGGGAVVVDASMQLAPLS